MSGQQRRYRRFVAARTMSNGAVPARPSTLPTPGGLVALLGSGIWLGLWVGASGGAAQSASIFIVPSAAVFAFKFNINIGILEIPRLPKAPLKAHLGLFANQNRNPTREGPLLGAAWSVVPFWNHPKKVDLGGFQTQTIRRGADARSTKDYMQVRGIDDLRNP